MMRQLLAGLTTFAILSGFAACGKPPAACADPDYLLDKPQLCPDRASLGFAQEFNSGTRIGARPQESLVLRNGGVEDLSITSANFSGDSAFTVTTEPAMLPATVKGNKYFYVRVIFAPTEAKLYSGSVTVVSNAENEPSKTFAISGCGVPTDGGATPCYRDGGTGP